MAGYAMGMEMGMGMGPEVGYWIVASPALWSRKEKKGLDTYLYIYVGMPRGDVKSTTHNDDDDY